MTHIKAIEHHPADAGHTQGERPVLTLVAPDGTPRFEEFLAQPAPSSHIVQFYEDEGFLRPDTRRWHAMAAWPGSH